MIWIYIVCKIQEILDIINPRQFIVLMERPKSTSSKEDNYALITMKDHAHNQPACSCIYVLTVLVLILKQNVQPKHMTMEKIMAKGKTRNHKRSLRKEINVCIRYISSFFYKPQQKFTVFCHIHFVFYMYLLAQSDVQSGWCLIVYQSDL